MPTYSGKWSPQQQQQARGNSLWPAVPGVPTAFSATNGDTQSIVSFTAPTYTGNPATITGYKVTASTGGSVIATVTGSASPLTLTGLTNFTTYNITVQAQNGAGYGPAGTMTATPAPPQQTAYTIAGTYTFVAPSGLNPASVSVVAVGGGGGSNTYPNNGSRVGGSGGGGGGLGYKNNISVTAGQSYTVVVGDGGRGATGYGASSNANVIGNQNYAETGASSSFNGVIYATGGQGAGVSSQYTGGVGGSQTNADGGGTGGQGGDNSNVQSYWGFGGGAAGYSGNGGNGGRWQAGGAYTPGSSAGSGGGAGGAAGWSQQCGVGLLGEGASGAVSQAGSGGTVGNIGYSGGGASTPGTSIASAMKGAPGGVRVIYSFDGTTRAFPSTNTGNL